MSPIKKEPLLTHDRNLLIGKIFAAGAIISLILESVCAYFSTGTSIGMEIGAFVLNFASTIFFIFVLFILRYYLLNFKMHKTRIALMTFIILLIIEFFYGKLSTVLLIIVGHIMHNYLIWFEVSSVIQSILAIMTQATLLVTGIMLIAGHGDFVGGLRVLGVAFVLKAITFVAATFVRNHLIDEYITNQELPGSLPDMMSPQDAIQQIMNYTNAFDNILTVIILLIFICILVRARRHTLCWQDPL